MSIFQQEWSESSSDKLLRELAERYHVETETFDRAVCTGPILHGSIMPATPWEAAQVNRNAIEVRKRIAAEALAAGLSLRELARAITRMA